jgi:hypothetical protein
MNIPWWHFWNPQSGIIGGIIFGLVLCALYRIIKALIKAFKAGLL